MRIEKRYKGFNVWLSDIEVIEINLNQKGNRIFGWWKLSKDYWTLKLYFLRIHRSTLPF